MKAQGTELYVLDPGDDDTAASVLAIGCITSIDGIDVQIEQNEVTCLQELTRRYEAGLGTPGTASFGIYTDPTDPSHVRLHQLKVGGTQLKWAVGWSDKTGTPPTLDSGGDDFDLPDTRSWITFEGFMNSFPFSFAQNATVQSAIGVQVSGEPQLIPRSAS
ncbi:MAG: phage tail tube protein [Gammaproteobacteria bacterium]